MKNANKPESIDEYIVAAPQESIPIMTELKALIESTVPEAVGGISWNVPIYKFHGILAGFDVAKKHVSFGTDCLKEEDRTYLSELGYKTGKSTIQIKFDQQVPETVIKQLLIEQTKLIES